MAFVHQALFGYDRGHRLLAHSLPRGFDVVLNECDRRSDLSGYLPGALVRDWTSYVRGWPVGEWYAFARTYHNRSAPRLGTCWSHVLLVQIAEWSKLADPGTIAWAHRSPDDGVFDLRSYAEPLDVAPRDVALVEASVDLLNVCYIGGQRGQRTALQIAHSSLVRREPFVLVAATDIGCATEGESLVRRVWPTLPERVRAESSFNTLALGRSLASLSVCPPSSVGDVLYGNAATVVKHRA